MSLPRPTALGVKGLAFYLLLVGAFFAAPYANLFFLLLAFLTALGVLGLLWTRANVAGARLVLDPVAPVAACDGAVLTGVLGGRARARVGLALELDLAGHGRVTVPLAADEVVRARLPVLPRGLYAIERARLASSWPLGLFRMRVPVAAPGHIAVYPAPGVLDGDAAGGGSGLDDLLGGLGGGFVQPSGMREYRPGDDLRRVHWKASARKGALLLKEWEGGAGAGREVLLDRRADPAAFEHALSLLAALALDTREQKEVLGFHTQGLSASYGGAHRPWAEFFRALAGARALPPDGPAPPVVSPSVPRLPREAPA